MPKPSDFESAFDYFEEANKDPRVQEAMRELEQEEALEALAKALELSPRVLEPLIRTSREKHKKLVLTLEDAGERQEFVLSH